VETTPLESSGARRFRLPRLDVDVLLLILGWKLLVGFVALASPLLFPSQFAYPGLYDASPGDLLDNGRSVFSTWDSHHYLFLADNGYQPDHPWNAFYPLLPLSTRALTFVAGDSLVSALLICNLASLAGLYLLYVLVKERYSRQVALLTLALLLSFPTAFYLNLVYSEALFLLLAVVFFYCTQHGLHGLAATAAFFLPWTRSVGVFILAPQALALLRSARGDCEGRPYGMDGRSYDGRAMWSVGTLATTAKRPRMLWLLAPLAGLGAYFVFMHFAAEDPFAAFEAQEAFIGVKKVSNLLRPDLFFADLFRSDLKLHGYVDSLIDRVFFLWFVASLPLLYRRLDPPMFAFCVVLGFVPLFGTFMSYTRYVMTAFPIFIAYASWFESRPSGAFAVILPAALLQSLFLSLHSLHHWVA
jgi:hypothetical protein